MKVQKCIQKKRRKKYVYCKNKKKLNKKSISVKYTSDDGKSERRMDEDEFGRI